MGSRFGQMPRLENFKNVSSCLRKKQLIHGDFSNCLDCVEKGDLVYLDPPYDYTGRINRGEYGENSFSQIDLERLSDWLDYIDGIDAKFVCSYIYVDEIKGIAKNWTSQLVNVKRQIASFSNHRKTVKEIVITNYKIK